MSTRKRNQKVKPFKVFYGLEPGHWLMIAARTKAESIKRFDEQEKGTGRYGFRGEQIY